MSLADDLFIYPTKNQSAEQQDKDKSGNAAPGQPNRPGSIPRRERPLQLHPRRVRRRKAACYGVPRVVRLSAQLVGLSRETPERGPRSVRQEEDCSESCGAMIRFGRSSIHISNGHSKMSRSTNRTDLVGFVQ
jgi:hypothetical protein